MTPVYTYKALMDAVWNFTYFLIRLAGVSVVVMITWFGIKMMTARGDETKFSEAKKGLKTAFIGALVIFGVWTIIATLQYVAQSLTG